jgi:hypothetical protein
MSFQTESQAAVMSLLLCLSYVLGFVPGRRLYFRGSRCNVSEASRSDQTETMTRRANQSHLSYSCEPDLSSPSHPPKIHALSYPSMPRDRFRSLRVCNSALENLKRIPALAGCVCTSRRGRLHRHIQQPPFAALNRSIEA